MSRATHLKIKLKTLAAEARIIRKEERKALKAGRNGLASDRNDYERHYRAYESLREHRTGVVRSTARVNNIAYGFLRGQAYCDIENRTKSEVDLVAVLKLVKRFGTREDLARWPAWQTAATGWLDAQDCPAVNLPSEKEVAA
jgi:hypothetical protein